MKISLNWLKSYLDIPVNEDRLSEILTDLGLEVEGFEEVEPVPGGLAGVVVGEVVECQPHPNADRLTLTKVNIGAQDLLHIVCGAPNVAEGQKVLVATVGTTLYPIDADPWTVKKGKIRGELSQGMICAEDELGLGTDHSGIMVLENGAKPGLTAYDFFQFETDIVYDIALTPNRSDATSHLGVARDLVAFFRINHDEMYDIRYPDLSRFQWDDINLPFEVELENAEACPRYSGLSFTQVEVKESPSWIKHRLQAIGVRPINNIVDITNFVLHEYGQPLHAFDADKITDHKIIVKTLAQDASFISLDEQERKLDARDLMICDGHSQPMCIAGVFGGISSGVTESTTNIFLESAHFNAKWIRQSSMRHMLRTDAATCFEKGSDPNQTVDALKRAAQLFKKYAGAHISSEIVDVYPKKIEPVAIQLRYSQLNRLVGENIPIELVHEILRALEMEIVTRSEETIIVKVPTNKSDVLREADLIEEILRIFGYNRVKISNKIHSTLVHRHGLDVHKLKKFLSNFLSGQGFLEMMNLSLIESANYKSCLPAYLQSAVPILNTSNIQLDIMRPEMMLPALKAVAHNHNRKNIDLKLFEWGKSYQKQDQGYLEEEQLIVAMSGMQYPESWQRTYQREHDFFSLKKVFTDIFGRLHIHQIQTRPSSDPRFEYGLEWVKGSKCMATCGLVASSVRKGMNIKKDVFFGEFYLNQIYPALEGQSVIVKEMSRFPSIRRDLALVIDDAIKFEEIELIARNQKKKLIRDINLFDIYVNPEQIGKGKKSYAVSFIFEDQSKTLKDKEVDKIMDRLISEYENKLGATIRK